MLNQPAQTALTANQGWRVALARAVRKVLVVVLTASLLSVGILNQAHAQANSNGLDPTFGSQGIVTTNFSFHPNSYYKQSVDYASDVVIQPDGKIVVVGSTYPVSPYWDFAVTRYNTDGKLDKTFDSDGKQTIDFFHGQLDFGSAIALQQDGKMVIAGSREIYNFQDSTTFYTSDFALVRLTSNGRLDNTFGTSGKVVSDLYGDYESASDVAIQPDGKIVVAGTLNIVNSRSYRFALARYNSDGTLDDGSSSDSTPSDSFGIGGKLTRDFGGDARASAVLIQPDGKIVVAGTAYYPKYTEYPNHSYFALARYNRDGSPDTTFGTGGYQTTQFLSPSTSFSSAALVNIGLQPDGKIVAAGDGADGLALARYNVDGQPDTTFDGDGKQTTSVRDGVASDVIIMPDGKIVLAGHIPRNLLHVFMSPPPRDDLMLARYNSDGSPDTTFDDDGKLVTDLYCGFESASAVAVQQDGKLVVAGTIDRTLIDRKFEDILVVRYPLNPTSSAPRILAMKFRLQFIGSRFVVPPILGGTSMKGEIELCTQAPSDVVINLNDNLAVAHAQPTVTIPAGKYASAFTVTTTPVTKLETGTLTASLGADAKSIPLRVRPIKLLSLTLSPNTVQGTHGVTGVVELERPAFAGGVVVTLSSSDTRTAYPTMSQITIAPGSKRRSFTIRTNNVQSPRPALIRATANGITVERMLMVN